MKNPTSHKYLGFIQLTVLELPSTIIIASPNLQKHTLLLYVPKSFLLEEVHRGDFLKVMQFLTEFRLEVRYLSIFPMLLPKENNWRQS